MMTQTLLICVLECSAWPCLANPRKCPLTGLSGPLALKMGNGQKQFQMYTAICIYIECQMEVLTHGGQVQGRSEAVMGMVVGRGQAGDHSVWRAFCSSLNSSQERRGSQLGSRQSLRSGCLCWFPGSCVWRLDPEWKVSSLCLFPCVWIRIVKMPMEVKIIQVTGLQQCLVYRNCFTDGSCYWKHWLCKYGSLFFLHEADLFLSHTLKCIITFYLIWGAYYTWNSGLPSTDLLVLQHPPLSSKAQVAPTDQGAPSPVGGGSRSMLSLRGPQPRAFAWKLLLGGCPSSLGNLPSSVTINCSEPLKIPSDERKLDFPTIMLLKRNSHPGFRSDLKPVIAHIWLIVIKKSL